jgi:hypothetical protein
VTQVSTTQLREDFSAVPKERAHEARQCDQQPHQTFATDYRTAATRRPGQAALLQRDKETFWFQIASFSSRMRTEEQVLQSRRIWFTPVFTAHQQWHNVTIQQLFESKVEAQLHGPVALLPVATG